MTLGLQTKLLNALACVAMQRCEDAHFMAQRAERLGQRRCDIGKATGFAERINFRANKRNTHAQPPEPSTRTLPGLCSRGRRLPGGGPPVIVRS